MIETWVFRENLDAFLRLVAHVAGYDYSVDDRLAFDAAIGSTDAENGDWFSYEFAGSSSVLPFTCAIDSGTSVVHFRLNGPESIAAQIQLATVACTDFNITYRHG